DRATPEVWHCPHAGYAGASTARGKSRAADDDRAWLCGDGSHRLAGCRRSRRHAGRRHRAIEQGTRADDGQARREGAAGANQHGACRAWANRVQEGFAQRITAVESPDPRGAYHDGLSCDCRRAMAERNKSKTADDGAERLTELVT